MYGDGLLLVLLQQLLELFFSFGADHDVELLDVLAGGVREVMDVFFELLLVAFLVAQMHSQSEFVTFYFVKVEVVCPIEPRRISITTTVERDIIGL